MDNEDLRAGIKPHIQKLMKTKIAIVLGVLSCFIGGHMSVYGSLGRGEHNRNYGTDYRRQAELLHARLAKDGLPTNVAVIEKTLKAIDLKLKAFFPYGQITREDMIALAWLESGFHQHENGTHGERGLFQIMPDEFEHWYVTKDFYDIDVNTTMALRVLRYKQHKWHSAKRTIQAYNGIVRYKDGTISEKYWRAFMKRKIAVEELLGDK